VRERARRLRHARRLAAVACGAAALGAIATPGASAHVGVPTSVLAAGPYRLVVSAGPVAAGSGAALALRSTITARSSGAPVGGASVHILVATAAGSLRGSYRASGFGGVYSLLVPIPNADVWRSLRFTIRVDGPLGAFQARYTPPSLLGEWLFDPLVLVLAAVGAALFVQGFVRLRRRGRRDLASAGRLALFALGLGLLVGPLVSPLDPVGDRYLLSAHMLQHVLIGDAAPALILLSLRGPLVFFVLPRRILRALGHTAWVRRAAAWILRPRVAIGAWALAYGGWHIPAFYDYADTHQVVHDLEHASFVLAGLLVWSLLIDPSGRAGLSRGQRLGVAAAVFGMGTVVSDVLIFSLHPLYPVYAGQVERVFALSPLRDQQLAGLVMSVEQILTLGTFAVVTLLPALRAGRRERAFVAGRERLA
jgi:cytochrome c oxidase assembly factor CtaG